MTQGAEVKTLGEIVQMSNALTQSLVESGGELTPELEAVLDQMELEIVNKIDAYDMVLRRLDNEAEFFSAKAKELQVIAKGCAAVEARLKDRIKQAMVEMGRKEIIGDGVRYLLTNTKPKLVINEQDLPEIYKTPVVMMDVNKDKVIEDLNSGEIINGARFEGGVALRRYAKGPTK